MGNEGSDAYDSTESRLRIGGGRASAADGRNNETILADQWRKADRAELLALTVLGAAETAAFAAPNDDLLRLRVERALAECHQIGEAAECALEAVYTKAPMSTADAIALLRVIMDAEEAVFENPLLVFALSNVTRVLRRQITS